METLNWTFLCEVCQDTLSYLKIKFSQKEQAFVERWLWCMLFISVTL